jgi:hypothetical protein
MMHLCYNVVRLGLILLLGTAIGLAQELPEGWLNEDIGDPADEGSAMFSNDSFYVAGGGIDIWGTADQFHFVYRVFEGDGYIQARVDTVENTNEWAKAGVMMRDDLVGNSPHAMAVNCTNFGYQMQWRYDYEDVMDADNNIGGPADLVHAVDGERLEIWVRLERVGEYFTGFYSLDSMVEEGTEARIWEEVASRQIVEIVPGICYAGLCVTAHQAGSICHTAFTEVEYGDFATGITKKLPNLMVEDYILHANYPNPFNPTTTIPYEVNKAGPLKITIYDILGREVVELVNQYHTPGSYTVAWNAQSGASGIYFCRLEAANFQSRMMKMVLLQ